MFASISSPADDVKPLRVFILAGQSNMQGQGSLDSGEKGNLRWVVSNIDQYKHLVDENGDWVVRDDVYAYTTLKNKPSKSGNLTVGFGGNDKTIGPELLFGSVVGDAYDGDVLLIETSWGGKSLGKDFCPPSSVSEDGYTTKPTEAGDVGYYYQAMLLIVDSVLNDIKTYVPTYQDQGYEIAGFGWHHGWNDLINEELSLAYEKNLANFIRDVRKDFDEPNLPFVIATSSQRNRMGEKAVRVVAAQMNVSTYPEFANNVKSILTESYWREVADSPKSDVCHWNRNAESYCLIGESMGEAMMEAINYNSDNKKSPKLRK